MRVNRRRLGIAIPVLIAALATIGPGAWGDEPGNDESIADPGWLRAYLEKQREAQRVPALAAALVVKGKLVAASAVGFRKWGDPAHVTRDDRFHLGSDVKAMTATLVGVLVDERTLRWDMTIDEMFPALRAMTRPEYRKVTIVQLLSHMSGMPYQPRTSEKVTDARGRTVEEKRLEYVRAALEDPPEAPPGTRFIYGGGPILVASYIERRLKVSYERLMAEKLFGPLDMTTAGFGLLCSPGKLDGPWEHVRGGDQIKPIAPDPSQRSQARSAVGRNAHCSIIDFGRFVALHLRGARGTSRFLKPETFKTLHTPVPKTNIALGWGRTEAPWHKGSSLAHDGSNGMNYCSMMVIPDDDVAVCVMTNIGGADAPALCARVIEHLAGEVKAGRLSRR